MSNTLEERCRQLMIQRKFEQCEKEIETAMAENPHCAIPHNLMGILMETESNHILAMNHFRAAYALDPTYIPARYNMELNGQMYRTGKYAYTEEDCPVENDKRMDKSYTIIAGCGRLGASIAGKLSEQKKDVMIIDCDKTAFRKLPLSFGGLTLAASVTDLERLKVAEIDRATLFLAVTDDDCTNICAAQIAKEVFHIKKVITRIYDEERIPLVTGMGIDTICPTKLSEKEISDYI